MQPESRGPLLDMLHAANGIATFVSGKTRADFESDLMLRLAVERQFEIIGEALTRLRKIDPSTAERISEYQKIISFRNVLIHGYDAISNDVTWRIVEEKLPILRHELEDLLK
jgi:uncharacterized protein with HEPN domain